MVPELQGSQATSRIFSNPTIVSAEFQNRPSLVANRATILSSGPCSSHNGTLLSYRGPDSQKFFASQFAARPVVTEPPIATVADIARTIGRTLRPIMVSSVPWSDDGAARRPPGQEEIVRERGPLPPLPGALPRLAGGGPGGGPPRGITASRQPQFARPRALPRRPCRRARCADRAPVATSAAGAGAWRAPPRQIPPLDRPALRVPRCLHGRPNPGPDPPVTPLPDRRTARPRRR